MVDRRSMLGALTAGMIGTAGCLDADSDGDEIDRLEPERELWSFEADGRIPTTPAVANGRVHVGSFDRNVYALDTDRGMEQWRFETGDKVWSTPAVAGDTLYVGSVDHHVYAIGLEGGERWTV